MGSMMGVRMDAMAKKFPILPKNPERICWGCDRYCPAGGMQCGNGSVRSPHPGELFGDDWAEWEQGRPPAVREEGDAGGALTLPCLPVPREPAEGRV